MKHRFGKRGLGERGASIVEFALLSPILLLGMVAVAEFSIQFVVAAALDYGARKASRVGMTGTVDGSGNVASTASRTQAVVQAVMDASGGPSVFLFPNKLTVTVSSYGSIADAKAGTNPVGGANAGPGGAGQFVRYSLSYDQEFYLDTLAEKFLPAKKMTHTSTVLVKNEPFPSN